MKKVYFVSVQLGERVHAQGLGFTKAIYLHTHAADAEEAQRIAQAFCIGRGIAFVRCTSVRVAQEQALHRYTFVEQIHGLALEQAEAAIRAQDFGDAITAGTLADLRANHAMIQAGLAALAAQEKAAA